MQKHQYENKLKEVVDFWNFAKRISATEFEIGFNMAIDNCKKEISIVIENDKCEFGTIIEKILTWNNTHKSILATNSGDAGYREGLEFCLLDLQIILEGLD